MAVVATGFFDGVHLGHREVLAVLVSSARERGEEAIAVTFAQHPRAVLQQDPRSLRLLSSPEEKEAMLREAGVDRVEVLPFTKEFSRMGARDYVREVLVGKLRATAVVLGYDNRFGSDGLPPEAIAEILRSEGVEPIVVGSLFSESGKPVSSTLIRKALDDGRVEDASSMLGYLYPVSGVVVPGKQLGRKLGFPTANLSLKSPLKQIPGRGVYLTKTEVMGRECFGMTNVGDIIETNIFDFSEDIYSLEITVRFMRRLRGMRDFPSLEDLTDQLKKDVEVCRGMIGD